MFCSETSDTVEFSLNGRFLCQKTEGGWKRVRPAEVDT